MILDLNEYVQACYEHFTSQNSDGKSYYKQSEDLDIERAKANIRAVLEEGLEKEILSQAEFNAMCPNEKVQADSIVTLRFTRHMSIREPNLSDQSLVVQDL